MKNKITENETIDILGKILDYLKLYDIKIEFKKDGVLYAIDEYGNKWQGKEFFEFLTYDCLGMKTEEDRCDGIFLPEELLERYIKLSKENGIFKETSNDIELDINDYYF